MMLSISSLISISSFISHLYYAGGFLPYIFPYNCILFLQTFYTQLLCVLYLIFTILAILVEGGGRGII